MAPRSSVATDARRLAWAAGLLGAVVIGFLLVSAMLARDRPGSEMRDWRTGEIWACALGGCQLND